MEQSSPPTQLETRMLPLDILDIDHANARGDSANDPALADADHQLAASIRAHGLLENLVVTPRGDRFGVTAGGRRLRALRQLADAGAIGSDHLVPCNLVPPEQALEASVAENEIRVAMHPADQVRAFARLAADGAVPEQIADRFGVSVRTVQKRLRLAGLVDDVLDAYRAGRMSLETAQAFATTSDVSLQQRVFDSVSNSGMLYPHNIHRALAQHHARSDSAMARFVGVDDYVAAGGRTEDPLFVADRDAGVFHFLDPDVLIAVATTKLDAEAALYADSWKWTETHLSLPPAIRQGTAGHRQIPPYRAGKPTDAERKTLADSYASLDEIDDELRQPGLNADRAVELRRLQRRLAEDTDAIERQLRERTRYSANARKHGGVIVAIGDDGTIDVFAGIVRREDAAAYDTAVKAAPAPDAAVKDERDRADAGNSTAAADDTNAAAIPPKYSEALRADFRAMRTVAIRRALARDPAAAADLIAFTLLRQSSASAIGYGHYGYHPHALAVSPQHQPFHVSDAVREHPGMTGIDALPQTDEAHDWLREQDQAAAFRAFRRLPDALRASYLAHAVAALTFHQLGDDERRSEALEQLVRDLALDFPTEIRAAGFLPFPAESVWNRMNKALILDAARSTSLGEAWTGNHRSDKKAQLVAAAARDFRPDPSDPNSDAGDWLPAGFAADAGPRSADPDTTAPGNAADNAADTNDMATAAHADTAQTTAAPAPPAAADDAPPVDAHTGLPAFLVDVDDD